MKKLVVLVLTFLLVLTGCNTVEVKKVKDDTKTDNIIFHNEYKKVSEKNIYKYGTYDNVIDTIKDGKGIIYLGFPTCDLCQEITPLLNDVAEEKDVKEILYYNFKDIRDNNTSEYQQLAKLLSDYIGEDEEGNKRITAPTIIFTNNGKVTGIYIGTISGNSEEIISEEEKSTLKQNLSSLIDKMNIPEETTTEENQN